MANKTYSARPADITRQWHVIDVSEQVLGRAATQIATLLKGKHKPIYTPSMDTGDHVVIINADKVRVTGTKEENKKYYNHRYAGHPGSLKITTLRELRSKHPERIVENAVRRMLPRNALGRQMMTKLRVYAGESHPHQAQQPVAYELKS